MPSPSSQVHPVYAIVGQDRFLRRAALTPVLRDLGDGADSLGPTRVDGAETELADVLDEVRTLSLLGDRRIVIVDDADSFISDNRKQLEKYCSSPSETSALILICNSLPRNQRLYKIINQHGRVIVCEAPKPWAIAGWISSRARETYGKRVSAPCATALREHTGDSLGALDSELAKLAAFVGSRAEITPADVDALVGQHREEKVFAVMDAMSAGDTGKALERWEQVWATDRAAPGRAIAGLAWGVRQLFEARRDMDKGVPVAALAKRMHTNDTAALQRRLKRVSIQRLENQLSDLCAADHAVKVGLSTVNIAVEKFIVTHSRRSR